MIERYFEEFKIYFPNMAAHAVSYEREFGHNLLIKFDDGTEIIYHSLDHSLHTPCKYDGSEEAWKNKFQYRLIDLMHERGIDREYLSELTGISQMSISKYIHKKAIPSVYNATKIAKALRCSLSDLGEF